MAFSKAERLTAQDMDMAGSAAMLVMLMAFMVRLARCMLIYGCTVSALFDRWLLKLDLFASRRRRHQRHRREQHAKKAQT